jgi:hypothetical protein
MSATLLDTIKNDETNMAALVWDNGRGSHNVTVKDLDSGLFLPTAFISIASLETAVAKAKNAVGVK